MGIQYSYHRHVNVAGMQLHVDLFVDKCLAGGMVIDADF